MFKRASEIKRRKKVFLGHYISLDEPLLVYGNRGLLENIAYTYIAETLRSEDTKVLMITFKDYHEGTVIDTYLLAEILLAKNIDPYDGLRRIYVASMFSVDQALSFNYYTTARRLGVNIVVLYRPEELFAEGFREFVTRVLGQIKELLRYRVAIAVFVDENRVKGLKILDLLFSFSPNVLRVRKRRGLVEVVNLKSPVSPPSSEILEKVLLTRAKGWFYG